MISARCSEPVLTQKRDGSPSETCIVRRFGVITDPQEPSPTERSDADDVEQHACPMCAAQPGSPCRSRGGAVASAHHTRRFTKVPRLSKVLRVPTPADRRPGKPWRPGTPVPAAVDPDLPSADIRIGYARCSTLGQELGSQLDALSKHDILRDKIFSEKISTRVRVDRRALQLHQGTTPASSKNLPVGPSSGRVASLMAIAAPCSGVRTPRKPLSSVAT